MQFMRDKGNYTVYKKKQYIKLRIWRRKAHEVFDLLWERHIFQSRSQAYLWLSQVLEVPLEKCHMKMFNVEQCKKVIKICEGLV